MMTDDPMIRFVDETTGEVIEYSPASVITPEYLMTYAVAKSAGDAARVALAERLMELQRADPLATELSSRVDQAAAVTSAVEQALGEAFDDDTRKSLGSGISLDLGFARITWPKPASRWGMKAKPEQIAATDPDLAKRLGITQSVGNPSAPRVTIRPEKMAGGLR